MLGYENWKPDDLAKLYANKNIWHNTTDENEKRRANEENKKLRAMYGMGDEHDVSIGELSHYRNLADRQNASRNIALHLLCYSLDNIAVITASQTTIASDHDQTTLFNFALFLIRRREVARIGLDVCKRVAHLRKIRPGTLLTFLGLSELGGGDELHRFGDLHGALNALDTELDVLHGCASHHIPPPFN